MRVQRRGYNAHVWELYRGARHGVRNESEDPAELILIFGPRGPHAFAQTGEESFELEADH